MGLCASAPQEEPAPRQQAAPAAKADRNGADASAGALVVAGGSAPGDARHAKPLPYEELPPETAAAGASGAGKRGAKMNKSSSRLSLRQEDVDGAGPASAAGSVRAVSMEDLQLSAAERKAAGRLQFASVTRGGYVPYNPNKENQDRTFVRNGVAGRANVNLFGVADGHGEFGALVADRVAGGVVAGLEANADVLDADPARAIGRTVKDLVSSLATSTIDVTFSGCSTCFGVKHGTSLYIANVGTTRCVLGSRGVDSSGLGIEAVAMSVDHTAANPDERDRVLDAGARVEPLPGPPGADMGPDRVWLPDMDVPGLVMTRSIGDEVAHTVGVISAPEVRRHDLTSMDVFAVFASEGVWQWVSSREAVSVVYDGLRTSGNNVARAAEALIAVAQKRWEEEEEVIADLSAVVVLF